MASNFEDLKIAALLNTLKGCRLFAGLPPADLKDVALITRIKSLEPGEYLFREGEPIQGFYIIQRGAVNIHRVNSLGKEQVIHIFRAGESFAEATLATNTGYPADARAVESSQLLLVQRDGFLDLVRREPELALRMLASMSLHLRTLVGQIEDLTQRDVETRLANWLLKRCPDFKANKPVIIQLTATKRLLAAELGTISETLSRTLAKFREQGLLSVKGRTITVLLPARLAQLLPQS